MRRAAGGSRAAERIRTVADLSPDEVQERRVFVRVDYNVPLRSDGSIADATRIEATLPTLELLLKLGGRLVLASHLGRPGAKGDPALSLRPVAARLSELIGSDVRLLEGNPRSEAVQEAVTALEPGRVVLLENTRFLVGETKDDPGLGEAFAALGDVFVGDAFGVAHRAHASNAGVARAIRSKGGAAVAGFLMARELHFLRDALREPARPFVAVLGGAKISGKISLIHAILPRVDRMLIGGAMANTFYRALGLETGDSLVENDAVDLARDLMNEGGEKLLLPVDCIVADMITDDATTHEVDRTDIAKGQKVADIGSRSREMFTAEIESASTLLWNGPMGVFEVTPFSEGTFAVAGAAAVAAGRGAVAIVGGGDSAAAASAAGVVDRMTHVSTGGGASLDLLAGNELPGVSVLETVSGGFE